MNVFFVNCIAIKTNNFMKKNLLLIILLFFAFNTFAQIERGKKVNAPKIPENKKNTKIESKPKPKQNDEFDFVFEEEPKLRFTNQYENNNSNSSNNSKQETSLDGIRIEPLRQVNEFVNDDTSSIDEGELMVVEIEEDAQFQGSEGMVGIASYFSVWDTKNPDPYGIDAKEFEDIVPIKLYNITEGRNWAPVLDKTPITSHFGWRNRNWHKGTDIDLQTGDPVYAAFDGIVRVAGVHSGWGRTLILRHYNGLETLYGHLSKINFEPNTVVKAGEEIAKGGNTGRSSGSHLHFEVSYEGNQFDSENIYNYNSNPMQIRSQEFVLSRKVYDYLRGGRSRPANLVVENTDQPTLSTEAEEEGEEEIEEEIPVNIEKKLWYRVNKGDSLSEIARKFHTSVGEICRLNKISSYKKLFVGLKVRVK
jgi:murein DD-endopeptidase MepM/ murein hydrolase activator NlpD